GASAEASSLRHKVSLLEKQTKQLREALQGRVRALTTSEWHRRRDLEETEEMRGKLRDVYDKLERSSLPPSAPNSGSAANSPSSAKGPPRASPTATTAPALRAVMPSQSTGPDGVAVVRGRRESDGASEHAALRDEVARLKIENRELRACALGTPRKQ